MTSRALIASFSATLAACGGASSHVEPVTITIDGAGTAEVVVSHAPAAAPSAGAAAPSREAQVARELAELDAQMVGALRGPLPGGAPRATATATPGGGPKAVISIMRASVSGGPVANASAVVAGMAAGFRRCVNRELAAAPTSVTNGSILLMARIGVNGEVLSVTPSGGVGLPKAAIACLQTRVMSAQFAPPDGGSAKIEIPVVIDLI